MLLKKIALLGQQALNPGRLALLPERLLESKEASGKCHARQGEGGGAMASHHTEQRKARGRRGCDGIAPYGTRAAGECGVCQKFSQWEAFWRHFFCAVALRATEGEKCAYFELLLEISGLEERVLTRGVMKVLGRHDMPTYGTKNEGEN